jgi:hypothetical protein
MKPYDVFQFVVIATIVPASALYVWRKQAPAAFRRAQIAVALLLLKPQRAPWLRTLGRRLAPPTALAGACGGCASGCTTATPRA